MCSNNGLLWILWQVSSRSNFCRRTRMDGRLSCICGNRLLVKCLSWSSDLAHPVAPPIRRSQSQIPIGQWLQDHHQLPEKYLLSVWKENTSAYFYGELPFRNILIRFKDRDGPVKHNSFSSSNFLNLSVNAKFQNVLLHWFKRGGGKLGSCPGASTKNSKNICKS